MITAQRSISVVDHRASRDVPQISDRREWPTNDAAGVVAACDLRFRPNGRRPVRLSFDVRSGEFVRIIEPCPDRRTSIMQLLTGLAAPTGAWVGHGFNVGDVALVPNNAILSPNASMAENAAIWARLFRLEKCEHAVRIRDAFEIAGLCAHREQQGRTADTDVLQRMGIAVALLRRPHAIVMDFPFDDCEEHHATTTIDSVLQRLRGGGIAIVVVSSEGPSTARLCDRTVLVA
jgi:multiple sugar transport system ATP-binding protein